MTLTCLTDRFGKLKGLIKGLRAQPNRYGSAMEPLTVNRIVFYDTRTSQLHLISQCDLVEPLEELQRDLDTARLAALCADLVEAVVPLEEPQTPIYRLLRHTLEHLALGGQDPAAVRAHFIARLLRLAGFQPQVDACTGCNRAIQPPAYWSARQGGLLCPGCLHEDPKAAPALPALCDTLTALAEAAQPFSLDPQLGVVLHRRLDEFLRWRLDRSLKTLEAQG